LTGFARRSNPVCGETDVAGTRERCRQLYDHKDCACAAGRLQGGYEGEIRNDPALAQYENGWSAQCPDSLDECAEDAAKLDDDVIEGLAASLAEGYLAIVRAARTNIGLCRKGVSGRLTTTPGRGLRSLAWWRKAQGARDFIVRCLRDAGDADNPYHWRPFTDFPS
jgi:hypothetical protein